MSDTWTPNLSEIEGPTYLALAGAIAESIDSGQLPPGTRLPPQRDLAKRLNVTVGTVGRAYSIAKSRQLISGEVGRGTFVRDSAADGPVPNYLPERLPGTVDFACYNSVPQGLTDAVAAALSEAASRSVLLPLNKYPPPAGFLAHRSAGAKWIERTGLEIAAEQVLICNGSQQAIMLAMTALSRGSDVILAERLTYSGVKALSSLMERNVQGVDIDEFGLIPDALDEAIRATDAKLLYAQPTIHNPTGAMMPDSRRREIAEIIRRHEIVLIEDDGAIGGLLDRPPPIAQYAPEATIYINGLSKCVSPALRVSYMASPPHLFKRLSDALHAMTLANSPVLGEAAASLINSGAADLIARRNIEALKSHHEAFRNQLDPMKYSAHPAGFFLWLHLPAHWTAMEFSEAARHAGLSVVPADNFTTSGMAPAAVRVSVNPTQRLDVMQAGIDTLKRVSTERHAPPLTV